MDKSEKKELPTYHIIDHLVTHINIMIDIEKYSSKSPKEPIVYPKIVECKI